MNSIIMRLFSLASKGKWDQVDRLLVDAAKSERVVTYAVDNFLGDPNPDIRDLGASILQKAHIPEELRQKAIPFLYSVMHAHPDTYDGFRAACALTVHHARQYRGDIRKTLLRFTTDKDVGMMARGYLASLSRKRF